MRHTPPRAGGAHEGFRPADQPSWAPRRRAARCPGPLASLALLTGTALFPAACVHSGEFIERGLGSEGVAAHGSTGQTGDVLFVAGDPARARFVQAGADSLVWEDPLSGAHMAEELDSVLEVRFVSRRRGLMEGLVIGTAVGATLGLLLGRATETPEENFLRHHEPVHRVMYRTGGIIGGVIGVASGLIRGHWDVFQVPPPLRLEDMIRPPAEGGSGG